MMLSPNFFDVVLFLLSSFVNGPSFMSISSLVLKLWQFLFKRNWSDIRKSKIPPSEFCLISGDWGDLGIPNLVRRSLTKCYGMLQNSRLTAFTVFRVITGKPTGGGEGVKLPTPPLPTQIKPLGPCKSKPLKKLKSSRLHMFFKIGSNRKTPVLGSLFNKIAGLKVCNFLKIDSNTGFSCGYCKICKNSFLVQNLRWLLLTVLPVAASDNPTTVQ